MKGIKKAIDDLETQNKMIKIADKSPGGWKTVEEYLSDSIANNFDDERKLRAAESRALRKKQNSENHISTTMFILQQHLQHLTIGLGMSSKSSFPHNSLSLAPIANVSRRISTHNLTAATTKCTHQPAITAPRASLVDQILQQPVLRVGELDTGKTTAPMAEISEDEAESFGDKCTFESSFHFMPDDFDMNSNDFDFEILRNKGNVKVSLRKNLEHMHHIGASPSVIDTIENDYKIPFFSTPVSEFFQNNQSALQNANFVTCTVEELLKSGRIKETRAPPYIVSPLTVSKNNHNKMRLILDFNSFVYKDKIKFDDWRTMQDFVDKEVFRYKFD